MIATLIIHKFAKRLVPYLTSILPVIQPYQPSQKVIQCSLISVRVGRTIQGREQPVPLPIFEIGILILQEVIRDGFLRRHAPRILRRGFEDSVSASRAVEISLLVVAEDRAESTFAVRPGVGSEDPSSAPTAPVAVGSPLEARV